MTEQVSLASLLSSSSTPIANSLTSVLDQVSDTSLSHSSFHGHVLSSAQLAALRLLAARVAVLERQQ